MMWCSGDSWWWLGDLRAAAAGLAAERGAFLIETLVGAVLVAVIAVAMFGALDGAARPRASTKTRAGAAAVAGAERPGAHALDAGLDAERTCARRRDPAGHGQDRLQRRLARRVDLRRQGRDRLHRRRRGRRLHEDHLEGHRRRTSRSSPSSSRARHPGTGHLHGRRGQPRRDRRRRRRHRRAGVNVSINGPASDVQLTDANGCAFFGYEPVGGYNVTASASAGSTPTARDRHGHVVGGQPDTSRPCR